MSTLSFQRKRARTIHSLRKRNATTRGSHQRISSERVVNEHVIGALKRFKIIADKYRNRRKRFGLRFNLLAALSNLEQGF
jgi:hypothetical protein